MDGLFAFPQLSLGSHLQGQARVIVKRDLGGVAFWRVRFEGEELQLLLEREKLPTFDQAAAISTGSVIYFTGRVTRSRRGELSIEVKTLDLVARCEQIIPSKYFGMVPAHRYRDRVADLLVNAESFRLFGRISSLLWGIRSALHTMHFQEFSTGVLQEAFEAGSAEAFTTVCNANGRTYYLSLTSEIKLKRLVLTGFPRVFEILQSFRNEGISPMHSPEFTLLEMCEVGGTCESMMRRTESVITYAFTEAMRAYERPVATLTAPFARVSFLEACRKYLNMEPAECTLEALTSRYPAHFSAGMTKFTWVFKLINRFIAPHLSVPTFITELPGGLSPLVKEHDDGVSERAALIIDGIDIADVYTDENDPERAKAALYRQADELGKPVDESYLELLKYGLPQTGSVGLGINRLAMLLRGNLPKNIKETILFPLM